jgi:quercetin dioxygenase-like cupin family protein
MEDFVIVPTAGPRLPGAFEVTVRVRSVHTNGVMAVLEETLVPKAFVPPHVHQNDVWVYVLSGEIGVLVGDDISTAVAGDWALKPRNVQHAMWNAGDCPARIIEVLTPGGTERWFEEIAALADGDRSGFDSACRRHGINFFPDSPWIPELRKRYEIGRQ